jgi:cysteinyl-tRNA synthetase
MHEWRDHELLRRALEIFGLESLAEPAEAPPEVMELARERARARAERRFDDADDLRGRIEEAGWIVRDSDGEFQLVPRP